MTPVQPVKADAGQRRETVWRARQAPPLAPIRRGGRVLMCPVDACDARGSGGLQRGMGATGVIVPAERLDHAFAAREAARQDAAIIDLDTLGERGQTMGLCLIIPQAAPVLPVVVLRREGAAAVSPPLRLGLCHTELGR